MAQTFNPEHVLLSETIGQTISSAPFTTEFLARLAADSLVAQLGERVEMSALMERKSAGAGELSDAYFVGEGEKIGTAIVEGEDYVLEAKKLAVILPVTEEALSFSWQRYFDDVLPLIVDKFNKKINGAAFLGLYGNPFGNNVLAAATEAGNVIDAPLDAGAIYDLETVTENEINAFVGHRTIGRQLRGVVDANTNEYIFDRPTSPTGVGSLDGLPYAQLQLENGATFPEGTLLAGNFNNLKYGLPAGTSLRLKISDQATLSKVQNNGPDSGDVHMFEQDMQALRATFMIAVAIPKNNDFAALNFTEGEETEGEVPEA